ncbi:hypothetical protein Zmor_019663 [Zophobas morio]|uniref:Uncharacterized protein n=1 Tax=Zophobas morio TaxID=2755281 RepID=A0AA38I663_9CUCU|nr:hypothetical protein Zmor_019663 [Zophobas morio]
MIIGLESAYTDNSYGNFVNSRVFVGGGRAGGRGHERSAKKLCVGLFIFISRIEVLIFEEGGRHDSLSTFFVEDERQWHEIGRPIKRLKRVGEVSFFPGRE